MLHAPKVAVLSVVFFTSFSSATYAIPGISSVDGEIGEGGTLTIQGNGFTSLDTGTILYDQVSNQPEYSKLSSGAVVPDDVGPWSQNSSIYGNPMKILRTGDLRTNNSSAVYYGEGQSTLGWPRAFEGANNRKFYMSWWYKPNQTANQGGSNKFCRVWDQSDGNGTRISLTQMHMTYSGTSGNSETSWGTTQPDANIWNRLEIYVDADTNTITAWLNGKITQNVANFQKASTSQGLTAGQIGFDPSISSDYPNYSFRMTDIYVSPSPARVELSNSDTWNPASKREVLTPTSWSDGKIDVKLNYFSHDPSANLYIYVVDSEGNVNQSGFPLCEKCPGKPVSVEIK